MERLQVQKLLANDPQAFTTLSSLGIKTRRHTKYPNLVQFTYGLIDSADVKAHPIVIECRGLILDQDNNWNTVAFPFTRFFNFGEPGEAAIDWASARIQEKLDGSLLIVYWYAGEWHVATKGTPDGCAQCWDSETTFAEYFWSIVKRTNFPMDRLVPGWTYCFEITGEMTRIVTNQNGNAGTVTLLAMRDQAGCEHDVSLWADQLPVVRHFSLSSAAEVIEAAKALDPLEQEGYVVVDRHFNRVKIKSPRYVAIHYSRFSMSQRALLELLVTGDSSEIMTYFPDLKVRFDRLEQKLRDQGLEIDQCFAGVRAGDFSTRKEAAIYIMSNVPAKYRGAIFDMYDGKAQTGLEWLYKSKVSFLLNLMKISDKPIRGEES